MEYTIQKLARTGRGDHPHPALVPPDRSAHAQPHRRRMDTDITAGRR